MPSSQPKKRSHQEVPNLRLDLFLQKLQIEKEKREKIVKHVEELAQDIFQRKTKPKLRLQAPGQSW